MGFDFSHRMLLHARTRAPVLAAVMPVSAAGGRERWRTARRPGCAMRNVTHGPRRPVRQRRASCGPRAASRSWRPPSPRPRVACRPRHLLQTNRPADRRGAFRTRGVPLPPALDHVPLPEPQRLLSMVRKARVAEVERFSLAGGAAQLLVATRRALVPAVSGSRRRRHGSVRRSTCWRRTGKGASSSSAPASDCPRAATRPASAPKPIRARPAAVSLGPGDPGRRRTRPRRPRTRGGRLRSR